VFGTVRADKLTRSKFKSLKLVIPLPFRSSTRVRNGKTGMGYGEKQWEVEGRKTFQWQSLDILLTPLVMFLGARVRCGMSSKRGRCARENALTLVNSRNLHLEVISFCVREKIV